MRKKNFKIKITAALMLLSMSAVVFNPILFAVNANPEYGDTVVFSKKNIGSADMRKRSDIDEELLAEYIKKYPKLEGIEEMLIEAQELYDVNLILLLAIIRLESGNGTSNLAVKKNNLGGIVSGKSKGKLKYRAFSTKEACVEFMADLLGENYLSSDGKYYKGYTINAIAKSYSQSKTWSKAIKELVLEIQNGIEKIK